ncbi:hypothetical protein ACHWQZ_G010601 [Mnemiopsis leidyi]
MDNLNRTLLNKSQGTGTQMADSTTQTVGPNVVNLTPTDSTISLLNEPVTQPGDCKSSEVISTTNPPFSDTSSLYCPSINHSLTEEPIILSNELLFSQFSVEALIEELDFTHDIGNRKVVYFGTRPYAYNGGVHEPKDLEAHTYLAKVCNYLDIIIPNYDYNSVLVTLYANGNQFIPKHSDLEDCIEETSDIVTVSLGATRTLIITDSTSGQVIKELELKHGAVSVMTKTSQSVYKHEIIRDRECKRPRVSVTFRLIKPPIPPKQVIHKPNPCVRNLKCDSFVSSSSSGYVPFDNIAPNAPKIKPLSHINPPVLDCKTKSQLIDKHQVDNLDTKSTALFISSSMFRNLDEDKASPGRNDVVNKLNTLIKELCHNKAIDYMDSSILFKFKSGNRREMFFQTPNRYIQDNCHLNFKAESVKKAGSASKPHESKDSSRTDTAEKPSGSGLCQKPGQAAPKPHAGKTASRKGRPVDPQCQNPIRILIKKKEGVTDKKALAEVQQALIKARLNAPVNEGESARPIVIREVKLMDGEVVVTVWDRPSRVFAERSLRRMNGFRTRVDGGVARFYAVVPPTWPNFQDPGDLTGLIERGNPGLPAGAITFVSWTNGGQEGRRVFVDVSQGGLDFLREREYLLLALFGTLHFKQASL